ncbi:MAG: hypothetical protein KDC84_14045 [Crocinitomicaceae bacterium]|nr:hypothetical protein [Crocinitomicaceae bacterium]
MKKIPPLYLFLFITCISCAKQGKNIYVEGLVYNPINGSRIEGVELKLSRLSNSSSVKVLATSTSSQDGTYILKANGLLGKQYSVCVSNFPNNYILLDTYSPSDPGEDLYCEFIKMMQAEIVNVELVPKKTISVVLNNTNCINTQDSIHVELFNEYLKDLYYIKIDKSGCIQNYTEIQPTTEGYTKIYWDVTKNGITNSFSDSIFVSDSQQSVTFNIDY